jgi:hypothetical protein
VYLTAKRMTLNAMTTPAKKPKAARAEFADAHKACRTPAEREQLVLVLKARWTSAELHEYARLYYFKNGRDYPTPTAYRRAIVDLAGHYSGLQSPDAKLSNYPHDWLRQFRKGGSKPLPPRREGLLQRGRGNGPKVTSDEYAWPEHTEEFRSMIEHRTRDYFSIAPEQPVHVNAWAASQRAYDREQQAEAEALRKETEAVNFHLVPKSRKKSPKGPRHKFAPQFDDSFWGQTLKPHFNFEFPGHTAAFREEVAALARKDRGKKADAHISPQSWKIACHKHYVLIESNEA